MNQETINALIGIFGTEGEPQQIRPLDKEGTAFELLPFIPTANLPITNEGGDRLPLIGGLPNRPLLSTKGYTFRLQ